MSDQDDSVDATTAESGRESASRSRSATPGIDIGFFGSPAFSARLLEKIIQDDSLGVNVRFVVTHPDRHVGRDQVLTPSPVKVVAQEHSIEVLTEIPNPELHSWNLSLVYAYGRIIPLEPLHIPRYGYWNIHPSLLPFYRGASPVAYQLLMGEERAGCTLIKMDEQVDHGPVIDQDSIYITQHENQETLLEKLTYVGYYLFKKNITLLQQGKLDLDALAVQNDTLATFTRPLDKDDGFVDSAFVRKALNKEKISSEELPLILKQYLGQNTVNRYPIPYAPYILFNMFRGLHPWPGIWTEVDINGEKKRLKITLVSLDGDAAVIHKVQLEGKNEVDFRQFNDAYSIF